MISSNRFIPGNITNRNPLAIPYLGPSRIRHLFREGADVTGIPLMDYVDHDYKVFENKGLFIEFLNSCFREPGTFGYNEYTQIVRRAAAEYEINGYYVSYPEDSYDSIYFYEKEKEKCLKGLIVDDGNRCWYFPGEYYMWLNYLPIYNKEKQRICFADISDAQHYMAMYDVCARYHNRHSFKVKKRQIASSYYHSARLINALWFREGVTLKLLAYQDSHLELTWSYLEEYKNFLNLNTAWTRHFRPERRYEWKQQYEVYVGGIKATKGLKSSIYGLSLYDDPIRGVGGPCYEVMYEEPGISPTLLNTYNYMKQALKDGEITTGLFIASGTVGKLDGSSHLRSVILNPDAYDCYGVDNRWVDGSGVVKKTGCFIPVQYRYIPFVDAFGNSDVENAVDFITDKRNKDKKRMSYEDYVTMISQEPITLEDAFDYKQSRFFPTLTIKKWKDEIEAGAPSARYSTVDIYIGSDGKIFTEPSKKRPISEFPLNPGSSNKEGVVQIWEEPDPSYPFGTYIAGIDPVGDGITVTSESLASIYVFRRTLEKTVYRSDGTHTNMILPSRLVCCWTGRLSTLDDTNERMLTILRYYNARAVVEANISSFIQYVIRKKFQHLLIRKSELQFLKDLNLNMKTYNEYGFKKTSKEVFYNMLEYLKTYMLEEIEDGDGDIYLGIKRIGDVMLFEEMLKFEEEKNFDRIIACMAAVSYLTIIENNAGFNKSVSYEDSSAKKSAFLSFSENRNNLNSIYRRYRYNPFRILK